MPMVPTVFKSGKGVKDLFHKVIEVYESSEDQDSHYRHIHINHGHEIEHGIKDIQEHLKKEPHIRERYSTRFLAIKLLERDKEVEDLVRKMPDAEGDIPSSRRGGQARERGDQRRFRNRHHGR